MLSRQCNCDYLFARTVKSKQVVSGRQRWGVGWRNDLRLDMNLGPCVVWDANSSAVQRFPPVLNFWKLSTLAHANWAVLCECQFSDWLFTVLEHV